MFTVGYCVNFNEMRYGSTSFNRIVADNMVSCKSRVIRCDLFDRFFVFTLGYCVSFNEMRYGSTSFNRLVADIMVSRKPSVIRCDLSDQFFCVHARLLCEFPRDEIWANKFQ